MFLVILVLCNQKTSDSLPKQKDTRSKTCVYIQCIYSENDLDETESSPKEDKDKLTKHTRIIATQSCLFCDLSGTSAYPAGSGWSFIKVMGLHLKNPHVNDDVMISKCRGPRC